MSFWAVRKIVAYSGRAWLYPDGRLTNGLCWVKLPKKWVEKLQADARVRTAEDMAKLPNLDEVLEQLAADQSEWLDLETVGEDPYTHRPVVGCHFDGRTYWFGEVAVEALRACGATTFHLYPKTGYLEGHDWGGGVVGGVKACLVTDDGGGDR